MPKYVLLDLQEHVLTVTLNRPDKLNSFINEMLVELRDAVVGADSDPEVRALVLTGAGRAFCSGADIGAFKEAVESTKREGRLYTSVDQDVLESFAVAMGRMSTPVIAAINGPALGLGFTLSLACDIRIASERATLGAIFARMGLTPEFGSTYNLVRLIGIAKACELVFTAKVLSAQEANGLGLVNQVVSQEELMPAAMAMAKTIAGFPPMAIRYAKRNLYSGLDANLLTQAHLEIAANRVCRAGADHEEAVNAFLEKRQPVFRGR